MIALLCLSFFALLFMFPLVFITIPDFTHCMLPMLETGAYFLMAGTFSFFLEEQNIIEPETSNWFIMALAFIKMFAIHEAPCI